MDAAEGSLQGLRVVLNIFKTQKQNLSKNGRSPRKRYSRIFFKPSGLLAVIGCAVPARPVPRGAGAACDVVLGLSVNSESDPFYFGL